MMIIKKSNANFSRILRKVSGQIERQLLQNLMNPIKRKLRSFSRLTFTIMFSCTISIKFLEEIQFIFLFTSIIVSVNFMRTKPYVC